ncbi:hypothetical protein [Bacillus alkalicellulosilyticus]|nr:hypothetical protein [Bacillus alkalicellulosilyticus]
MGGAWDGWRCIGCSLAVSQVGQILVQGKYDEEQLLVVDVIL